MPIQFSAILNAQQAELLAVVLLENNALSVSLLDAKDNPIYQITPDEQALWPHVKLLALFPNDSNRENVIHLAQLIAGENLDFEFEQIIEQDWVRITQQHFKPQCFGTHLWICPSWYDEKKLSGQIVKIDPGVAFGTGSHATTSLCLEWLAENSLDDKEVIDFGCGSGILALAALALGAKKVWAFDHDPQAIDATRNNAAKNNFATTRLEVSDSTHLPNIEVDLIIANILATPLIELAPTFTKMLKNNGTIVLSGILSNEKERVISVYQQFFQLTDSKDKEDWCRLVFSKNSRMYLPKTLKGLAKDKKITISDYKKYIQKKYS